MHSFIVVHHSDDLVALWYTQPDSIFNINSMILNITRCNICLSVI